MDKWLFPPALSAASTSPSIALRAKENAAPYASQ